MEKKNTILLTVIAIATLLVAVAGATFAYFAGQTQIDNVTYVNGTTAQANSLFDVVGSEVSFNITADLMQKASADDQNVIGTKTATVEVNYTSGSAASTSCTYDLSYKWVSSGENGTYTLSTGATNEFTYSIASTGDGANLTVSETNFANTDTAAHKLNSSALSITNASASDPTTQTYTITVQFYNLKDINQSINAGKTLSIKFYVDKVVC